MRLLVFALTCLLVPAAAAAQPHDTRDAQSRAVLGPCGRRGRECPCGEWRIDLRKSDARVWGSLAGANRGELQRKLRRTLDFETLYARTLRVPFDSHYADPSEPYCQGCI